MLRIHQNSSERGAKDYYTSSLDEQDYYTSDVEIVGEWHGRGAIQLGLDGRVTQEAFFALCENRRPETDPSTPGERLTARNRSNRTVNWDLTFSVPKSVSIVHAITRDTQIETAFRDAYRETMAEIEADVKTRVRKLGANDERVTGNLVWADFVHHTARPSGDVPDMHLHAHCVAFNATWDAEETAWKACTFRDLKRHAPYYEAVFHARLAHKARELGFSTVKRGRFWEIDGIDQEVIDRFSKRTQEVEAEAKAKGIYHPDRKAELGAKTRQNKADSLSGDQLRAAWEDQMSAGELRQVRRARSRIGLGPTSQITAEQAVEHAIAHVFERSSVVSFKMVKEEALRYGVGDVTVEQIHAQMELAPLIRREKYGETFCTTHEIWKEEQFAIRFAAEGRATLKPLMKRNKFEIDPRLNDDQRTAVAAVLTSEDRVMMLRGVAGSGKTTLLRELVRHATHKPITTMGNTMLQRPLVITPGARAARSDLPGAGLENTTTVAKFLGDSMLQASVANQLLVIDEAGKMGSRQFHQICRIAKRTNARVLLVGDPAQHRSVERGTPMQTLERHAGITPIRVDQIVRQDGPFREAIEDLAHGRPEQAFEKLDELGAIKEIESPEERYAQLARDYVDAVEHSKKAMAVSPTHAEGRRVTEAIRSEMRDRGQLHYEDRSVIQHRNLNWTEAEKRDSRNYQVGMVIEFHRNVGVVGGGTKAGDRYYMTHFNKSGDPVFVDQQGNKSRVRLGRPDAFSVYERGKIDLAVGDKIRITQNSRTTPRHSTEAPSRAYNGDEVEITGFTQDGSIVAEQGRWHLHPEFAHVEHGYCGTSHAAQAATCDEVFVAQGAQSWAAADNAQAYVSASRARERATFYTDDKELLRDAFGKSREEMSAMDLTGEKQRERELERRGPDEGRGTWQHSRREWVRQQAIQQEEALRPENRGPEQDLDPEHTPDWGPEL